MTEQDVRLILANYAKSSWSMDDDFARNVAIVRIEQVVAYHYKLRTFTEQRSIRKILEPFKPTAIDEEFTCNLATPPLWKMPIFPKTSFHSHDIKMDVPDMTIVGWCDMCHGGGQVDCACATRRRSCPFCSIDRKCTCRKCNGQQTLRYRLQLTVKWSSYQDDFVSLDCTTLTDKQLIQAQGVDLLNELCYQVSPVTSNADKLIREKSTELIDKYKSNTLNKIIRQQQVIRAIPVTIVTYRKESHDSRFFVYGHDNRVNFPLERRDNSCIIS
ncbi:Protein SSUH2 -like protein [Halotydeus destructor]|nr:Protein SSUH2 -like protein [Halotydeus destructor]